MTDEEVLEDNNREERGEYLDIDTFLALEPEEDDASL